MALNKGLIFFTEKNIHGAWVVCGVIGYRQYYGYTKKQAIELYKEECKGKVFYNESPKERRKIE